MVVVLPPPSDTLGKQMKEECSGEEWDHSHEMHMVAGGGGEGGRGQVGADCADLGDSSGDVAGPSTAANERLHDEIERLRQSMSPEEYAGKETY
jgi:hypothetical protein